MAKRYFVRYFIETPNSVGNRKDIESGKNFGWKFNFGNTELGLYDNKQGLYADCYIDAESLKKSEEKSKTFVENILNLIDFSTSSASSVPLFVNIYDASLGLVEREYKQVIYKSISERNINVIDKDIFSDIFNAFNKNNDERIVRAISWLRKGYLEQKHVDKFIAFWTGLEAINELLCDFFKVPEEDRKSKCDKCESVIFTISTIGIKKVLIDELGVNKELFNKIRRARGKLLHGGGPLDNNFVNELKEYNPKLRNALLFGIGKLLQMNDNTIKNIIEKKPKTYTEKIRIIIKAKLANFNPPNLSEFGKQPRIDLTDQNLLKRVLNEQGKLNLKSKIMLKSNANFNNITYEVWGEDNTCITSIKIDEIKKITNSCS